MGGKGKARKKQNCRHGEAGQGCGHDHGDVGAEDEKGKRRVKRKKANAYETAPKVKKVEAKS